MENIRELLADDKNIEYATALFNELKKEFASGSDRGMTIVSASMLDNLLKQLLETLLIENLKPSESERLFRNNGPLSNYSSKILMAHSLGLISDFEKKLLNNIRSVRNRFAHELETVSFSDDSISGICINMIMPDDLIVSMNIDDELDGKHVIYRPAKNNKREVFQMAVYVAITMIAARKLNAVHNKHKTPDDFKHRKEFIHTQINSELNIIDLVKAAIDELERRNMNTCEKRRKKMDELLSKSLMKLDFFYKQYERASEAIVIEKENMFTDFSRVTK